MIVMLVMVMAIVRMVMVMVMEVMLVIMVMVVMMVMLMWSVMQLHWSHRSTVGLDHATLRFAKHSILKSSEFRSISTPPP